VKEISMSTIPLATMPAPTGSFARFTDLVGLADRLPLWIVQLAARVAVWHVFWASAQTKLASWDVTIVLFQNEYALPLLPPEVAAYMGTAVELGGSVLILFGLGTRFAALALLGLVAVIQFFVYPGHWAEHLMWASLLALLFARGAGLVSIDHLIRRFLVQGR
jgi:putative oxidoreductase